MESTSTTQTNSENSETVRVASLNKRIRAAAFFGATVGAPIGAWIGYEMGLKRGIKGTDLARFTVRRLIYGSLAFGSFMMAGVLYNFLSVIVKYFLKNALQLAKHVPS